MVLGRLLYFVTIAKARHITHAAAQLGIQQAPLSQQIKVLEQEVGVGTLSRQLTGSHPEASVAGTTCRLCTHDTSHPL
ncbi:LysR family transcriptional regulator [Pectobacteriaceae bacterium C52]|nr:LysR family transcriptional regulator [Pectobacteriaceae bacterium C52]